MPAAVVPKLFQPTKLGRVSLSHRVVLAPLTRFRNTKTGHVPVLRLSKEYYTQRAKVPGSLLITEATVIAPQAGGYDNVPGIWSDEQVDAWKQITDAVHAAGSSIFMQLCGLGRAADPSVLATNNPPLPVIGPSNIPLTGCATPRPLTIDEIHEYAELFARAAHNAVHRAGFDGVELHGANGYLLDQFLQEMSNDRTDEYGGSVENRSRFVLEAVEAVARAVGPERTALRLSPWNKFQDMGMKDPVPQYTHLVTAVRDAHPSLAYLHVVEPRISGDNDRESAVHESNDFIRAIWQDRPYITAGGYTAQTAMAAAERGSELVAFGRHYISNPDLPLKLKRNMPLTPYNRTTFYAPGEHDDAHVGYIDYPFTEETV
ncbi:putative nadh flavin oxidoreductase nadh oxidase [Lyophyllum shimeji]|uniref:Nadh flavin oxidoreductase nadh oxidase n=1 Tax=Lyophyllum shimeji TaxID=47721 RepID=A0A9P3PZ08_LYOSH|nr:putative nadh flavin oxidoreductase nadh oxidase [Lyophyllum shimeji]